ncbi:hypothetical protein MKZ38_006316 [Zalerion maritima]|uniref:Uncharacterized protein n=1 Tax=Zalerion maritima TaxID=339359 RepID=A0AAD5RJ88_9PEZI|nr:hypothetical protein MKZ38_006316 [Zalerion maritima]
MDLNADLNNEPIRDEKTPDLTATGIFETKQAPQPTTLLIKTKLIERRQDSLTTNVIPSITVAPTISDSLVSSTTVILEQTNSATPTSPIVIFPDCLTCAPGSSAIPAAITDSCATAHWTLIRLSTAYIWAPVVGCSGEKPECCVYGADPVSTVTETTTNTIGQLATITHTQHEQSEDYPFPTASEGDGVGTRETLMVCPADHETVAGDNRRGCCPFGFTATSALGAQTPCATIYPHSLEVPEVPASSLPTKGHIPVVQTISDSILAAQYSLPPPPEPKEEDDSMPMGKKVGIAIGSGLAGVVCGILLGWAIMRNRRRDREIEARKTKKGESQGASGDASHEDKGKGKEVDYSEVLQQRQVESQQQRQQQQQQQQQQSQHGPQELQIEGQPVQQYAEQGQQQGLQGYQVYPVYPPPQVAYAQQQDEISPVSPASLTTGSMPSWGTSTQPLWGTYNSSHPSSSSQEVRSSMSQGRCATARMS